MNAIKRFNTYSAKIRIYKSTNSRLIKLEKLLTFSVPEIIKCQKT